MSSGPGALPATPPPLPVPQAHLASHLLDLVPVEDEAPAHELIAGKEVACAHRAQLCPCPRHPGQDIPHTLPGSTKSSHPLLTLFLAVALKVILPLGVLDETCRGRGPICPSSLPPPPMLATSLNFRLPLSTTVLDPA